VDTDTDSRVEDSDGVEDMEATILTPADQNNVYPVSGSTLLASSSDVASTSPAAAVAVDGRHR